MQALRTCALCSMEGLLCGRTDFLHLRSNMAVFARGLYSVGLLRNTACILSSRRPTRRKLPQWTRALSVSGGLCALPFYKQVEDLSHEAIIRRASSLVTDSANTYLSQTTLALVDALTQYTRALHTQIALQKRYLTSLGKLTADEEDAVWQVIIGQRVEVGDKLEECKRYEANWANAISLCELAAQAAHNAGANEASATTQSNLQVAQSQVEQVRQLSLVAERKLAETKAEEIQRVAEFAASMEKGGEDLPEAYLRED
ncbi:diablo, IAP-binding mitochondrial protein a [Brienomyrus brachyistius]|uniref:diablo, IAP-binding mitochondrial protein a n=1 Tax=Brienomyrus brachyistius TaxID=42636 RepID=UPI0020B252DB|nr:diablo, IAP-binding mitochondrial protein a [Brienomyrus brachyistius]